MEKTKKKIRLSAALAALLLLISALALPVSAAKVSTTPGSISETAIEKYTRVPILLPSGERLSTDGRLISSTTYVPLRAFFSALAPEAELTYNAKTRTATLSGEGLSVSASDRSNILYANGRCIYADMPIRILADGTMYAPIRSLAKVLSLDVAWNNEARSVSLTGEAEPLLDGSLYYDADELYWLSRIISAESRGEPFIGQVAVGNVVLNRVAHKDFPNTIWGVIFDKRHGVVQFSPVSDGSIWQTPHATSVTAAKVCLEGYTVSERILFFYAPSMVSYTWIEYNRPYAFTIAGHRFFY